MVLQKQSKMYRDNDRAVIYIPNSILNDSAFPFSSTVVNIRIEGNRIVIEGVE